jgi:capsular exopolysaccharide synthesis family protein
MAEIDVNSQGVSLKEIKKIGSIARKNWWILLIFLSISLAIGNLFAYKQTNIFSAQTSILLKSNDQFNPGSVISEGGSGSYYSGSSKTFVDNSNEKRILQSYDLVADAIQRLDFNVSYFIVGRIKTMEAFQNLPIKVKVIVSNSRMYENLINLKVTDLNHFQLSYVKEGNTIKVPGTFGEDLVNTDMHIIVQKSKLFAPSTIKQVEAAEYQFQIHSLETLVSRYRNTMVIDNPNYTNILTISVEDIIPERATMFLDTLTQVYIEKSLDSRFELNKNTLFYIDNQMGEVTDILNNIEDTMENYLQKNAILNLSKEGEQYFNQYFTFDSRKKNLQLQLNNLNDLEKYIIGSKDSLFLPPSTYLSFDDKFLEKNATTLFELQMEYNQLLNMVKPGHQGLMMIEQRIDSIRSNMLNYMRNDRVAIRQLINNVNLESDTSKIHIQSIPAKQRGLTNIERRRKVNEELYIFLLKQRANTVIARADIIPLTKIIERSRSMGVIRPDKNKILYFFLGVGLGLAALLIVIRVLYFDRIESYDELKAATSLPIVGEIIRSKELTELKVVVDYDPKSAIAESFRTVRTNLQYMLGDKQKGAIVLTSNNPGEGKTFCSINLAAILAKGGKRTVIMELDLHKPRVQKGLGIESNVGISTYVIGKSSIEEIISPSSVENMDVVLAGPLPPNPSEIIVSQKMTELLNYCKDHYDFVIIDTPPVGLITDALVLMKQADVTLFVMNTQVAYRHSLQNAHDIVSMNKLGHFGFILNGVKQRRSKYYYNKYNYGYKYGAYGQGAYGGGYGSYGSYGGYGKSSDKKKS